MLFTPRLSKSAAFTAGLLLVGVGGLPIPRAFGQAAENDSKSRPPLPRQVADDEAQPLRAAKPREAADQSRVEAMSWFMAGQIKESRGDRKEALKAYRKAVELDPGSVDVYRALIPLLFEQNQKAEAIKYGMKAIELDPDNFKLLQQLGIHQATQGNLPEALQLLEKASKSKTLPHDSKHYVAIMRSLAILYRATGQKKEAADAYDVVFDARRNARKYDLDFRTRAALEADPNTSYETIGQAFLDADRPKDAIRAFELAEETGRGQPGTLGYNLARVYFQTKQYDKALSSLQKYFDAQLQSKGRAAYQLLADVLKASGKSDELARRLEKLAQEDPRNSNLQYFLAEQYASVGRLKDAEKLYKKTLESAPSTEGYAGLASVYRQQKRPAQLIEVLANVAKEARSLEDLAQSLARLDTEVKAISEDDELLDAFLDAGRKLAGEPPKLEFPTGYILARVAVEAHKTDAVVEFYRIALNAVRDRRDTRALAFLYGELGDYLYDEKEYARAAKIYSEAVADGTAKSSPVLFFRLSLSQELAGNTEAALKAAADGRKRMPNAALFQYQEAWVYYHSRQWDKAIPLFEKVIKDFADSEDGGNQQIVRRCQFSLSNLYVQRGQEGDQAKGEAILEQVLAEDPDDPSVNNDLGYLWADQGKHLERAEKMIRKAVKAEPENAAYMDSMGWVLYKRGKFDEALEWLEKATKSPTGQDSTILDHLGDCYQQLGRTDEAVAAWEKALELSKEESSPDEKLVQRIEQKLKNHKQSVGKLRPEQKDSP